MPNKQLFGEMVQAEVDKANQVHVSGREEPLSLEYIETQSAILSKIMSTEYNRRSGLSINMTEALWSADASILFPKAINDVLMRPKEPMMIGQTLLAKTISVDNTRSVEFPTIGAVRAKDLADGQEYPEVQPPFGEAMTEIKVNKAGLAISVSEDVVNDSMWDVLALYIEAAGYAMMRHKEEKIFREFQNKAQVVFDNGGTDAAGYTTGVDVSGKVKNGTLAFNDLIDAFGVLLANEYVPTDIILHPLAWTIFMKDPRLQFQLLSHGTIGQTYGAMGKDSISQNLPWNINVAVTPFTTYNNSYTAATPSAEKTGPATDIYICDRNNGILILQREDMTIDQFQDPKRDITTMKFKERYGLGLLNGGKSAVAIKNVRIAQNYEPMYSVRNITP